jgi:hypothetical protein
MCKLCLLRNSGYCVNVGLRGAELAESSGIGLMRLLLGKASVILYASHVGWILLFAAQQIKSFRMFTKVYILHLLRSKLLILQFHGNDQTHRILLC